MSRRRVRVSESFFEQLDELFGPDRGETGEPSRLDFTLFELPDVMERFAVDWDRLPELDVGIGGGRVLLQAGVLVYAYTVYGLLMPDDTIELISITIDP